MDNTTIQQLNALAPTLPARAREMPEDRRAFFEGLAQLASADTSTALTTFKLAIAQCQPPFDVLSILALAECERLLGKDGRALRRLKSVIADPSRDQHTRQMALLAQLTIYTTRGDERMVASTQEAIDHLAAQG